MPCVADVGLVILLMLYTDAVAGDRGCLERIAAIVADVAVRFNQYSHSVATNMIFTINTHISSLINIHQGHNKDRGGLKMFFVFLVSLLMTL